METDLEKLINRRSYNDSSFSFNVTSYFNSILDWSRNKSNIADSYLKIAENFYQPAELTWSIASTISMRSNSFSVDSQSHLPHSGRPDLGLIIANLQLN